LTINQPAQLNSNGGATTYANPGPSSKDPTDPLSQWNSGFPSIRNAESHTLSLPNTFQAIIIDTPVASGSVHSPWKQPAGSRLARGGLSVAYNMDTAKVNPVALGAALSGGTITVKLGGLGAGGITLKANKLGFEALGADGLWHSTPITGKTADAITLGPAPAGVKAVRYLWYSSPCSPYAGQPQVPYHCPVYTDAPPLGALSGELDLLPLGPFVMPL
jgi:hypothetical protein